MARFQFTKVAEADLEAIIEYTLGIWAPSQTDRYLVDFQTCFQNLADLPNLGRKCERPLPGLMRFEHGRHVVFYRPKPYGIRIIRILHQSMLPDPNLLD